jgi:hypothetical protein
MPQGKGFLTAQWQEFPPELGWIGNSVGCLLKRVGNNWSRQESYLRKHYERNLNWNRSCRGIRGPANVDLARDGRPNLSEQGNVLRWGMRKGQPNASGRKQR